MPQTVVDVYFSRKNLLRYSSMCTLECSCFLPHMDAYGIEPTLVEIKSLFLQTLYEWLIAFARFELLCRLNRTLIF